MSFFKKNKKRIAFIISAVVILGAAFVFDGSKHGVPDKSVKYNIAPSPLISEKSPEPAGSAEFIEYENSGAEDQTAQSENGTVTGKSDVIADDISDSSEKTKAAADEKNIQQTGNEQEPKSENVETVISKTGFTAAKEDEVKESACTVSISCAAILDNMDMLDGDKADFIPKDGIILKEISVKLENGDSVFDLLARVTRDNSIHMEFADTPVYNTKYIEGIANIYELDCGSLSGWQYSVNGVFPNVGCSAYYPNSGDVIEWKYTCDLGRDIGNAYTAEGSNG